MGKQMNIPPLRFPEFEGEWERKKLEIIGEYIGGGTPNTTVQEYWEGNIPWISSSDIIEDDIHNINIQKFITEEAIKNSATKKIPANSLIIVSRVGVGKFAINKNIVCTSQDFTNIVIDTNVFSANFSAFNLYKNIDILHNISQGTSIKGFTIVDLKRTEISFPTLPEQTKIASFLTAVDEKLQALKKKQNLLENYKKGVMQKLFTQELRFKNENGNEFPEWELKKLGEIGTFQTSSIDKLTKENEKEVFLVNYMNVYRHENINNESIKTFQIVTAKDNQIESCSLKKGDILFTPSSETPDDIGHSVVIFEDLENAVFSYHLMRFRPNIEIDILYSHYFCNIPDVLAQLSKLATGSTRFTISVGSFSSVLIKLPSIGEQKYIADFLSEIDRKINSTNILITQTEIWKKGLLQKMFVKE